MNKLIVRVNCAIIIWIYLRPRPSMADHEVEKALSVPDVRYSRVWEDHRMLSRALEIGPEDVVLCITRYVRLDGRPGKILTGHNVTMQVTKYDNFFLVKRTRN